MKYFVAAGARCATDITGFGLLGHASHIARASKVTVRINVARVPILPGAREAIIRGVTTGGSDRNLKYLEPMVDWGEAGEADRALMIDPQTSGGLFIALSPDGVSRYVSRVPGAVEVGEVVKAGAKNIELV